MVFAWILAASLLVVVVILIIYFTQSRKQDAIYIQRQQKDLRDLESKLNKVQDLYTHAIEHQSELNSTIGDLRLLVQSYESTDQTELTRIKALIDGANQNLATINESISAASLRLTSLENDFKERQQALATELQSSNDARATLLEEQKRLQEQILTASQSVDALHEQKLAIESELATLKNELAQLTERNRIALLANWKDVGELGIKFETTNKETQLVAAINDICALYPELSRELKKIEWEKVWRPKMQVYRSELAGKQGIYKLTLADDVEVCYIGQARDIYTRWFEHAKKMIGVDAKGNEKLYEYQVGDFYWKVLEEVEDSKELNDAEKYWIEYWCCLEKGLNKKK